MLKKEKLNIKVFDIYDIIIDILKEKGFLEKVFAFEKNKGTKYISMLDKNGDLEYAKAIGGLL